MTTCNVGISADPELIQVIWLFGMQSTPSAANQVVVILPP